MFWIQQPWVDLYHNLPAYDGGEAYDDVLQPWVEAHAAERDWFAEFERRTERNWSTATGEDLCQLYALFRVTSILLLRFQSGRADGTDYLGPRISVEGFQLFHESLGFHVPVVQEFHPFYHEIVEVIQESDPAAPIQILEQAWPALMLGDLMFCRAGCRVSGGTDYVIKEVAETSKLYWTFRRKDRRCEDQSYGWGSNSQWRTGMRRDYRDANSYFFNVHGKESLNTATSTPDNIPVEAMIELVRHRGFVRSRRSDSDLCPYRHSFVEPR